MLLLMLPAALVLSGCVATPQPGITNSNTPSQVMSAQASAADHKCAAGDHAGIQQGAGLLDRPEQ